MFLLVARVQLGVVRFFVGNHFEEDLEESLSQTTQGAGMAHALSALLLVVGLPPGGAFAKAIGPKVNGVSQKPIARPAHLSFFDLA